MFDNINIIKNDYAIYILVDHTNFAYFIFMRKIEKDCKTIKYFFIAIIYVSQWL